MATKKRWYRARRVISESIVVVIEVEESDDEDVDDTDTEQQALDKALEADWEQNPHYGGEVQGEDVDQVHCEEPHGCTEVDGLAFCRIHSTALCPQHARVCDICREAGSDGVYCEWCYARHQHLTLVDVLFDQAAHS